MALALAFDAAGSPGTAQLFTDSPAWDSITRRSSGGYFVAGTTTSNAPIAKALDASAAVDPSGCSITRSTGTRGVAAGQDSTGIMVASLGPTSQGSARVELARYHADCSPDTTFGSGGVVVSTIGSADEVVKPPVGFVTPSLAVVFATMEQAIGPLVLTTFEASTGAKSATPYSPVSQGGIGPDANIDINGVVTAGMSYRTGPVGIMHMEDLVVRTDNGGPTDFGYGSVADGATTRWFLGSRVTVYSRMTKQMLGNATVDDVAFHDAMVRPDGALIAAGSKLSTGEIYVACFLMP